MSRALSLAGFQVTLIGRIWVTPEANRRRIDGSSHPTARMNCLVAQPGPMRRMPALWAKSKSAPVDSSEDLECYLNTDFAP